MNRIIKIILLAVAVVLIAIATIIWLNRQHNKESTAGSQFEQSSTLEPDVSLPTDKYVLLEIRETNSDRGLSQGFSIRPRILYSLDKKEQILKLAEEAKKPRDSTLIILGYMINFIGQARGGATQMLTLVDSLPHLAEISSPVRVGSMETFHVVQDVEILKIGSQGSIFLRYGRNDFFLKAGEDWSRKDSNTLDSHKYITQLTIRNYGVWDKARVERRSE